MRRLLLAVLAGALALGVALLPSPPSPPPPLTGLIIDAPGIESPADASIWYCPWAQASAERDSVITVASMTPADADFTFPVAIPGEPPDSAQLATLGPGAASLVLSDVAVRGDSPGLIEFSDGPAAAGVTIVGDVVAADACVATGPDEWYFVGGSTETGETLRLRLFNPFPETAKVTITGFSEIATAEALGDLRSISVNPRSWRDIDFEELLRQRQSLVISVQTEEGLVVPAMAFGAGTDQDWWMGTGASDSWELPIARGSGVDSAIVVANPGLSSVEVTVDLYMEDDSQPAAFTMSLDPDTPLRIGLGEVETQIVAARVSATGPVAVATTATGDRGTAVTAGAPVTGGTWLVPGTRSEGLDEATIWLLNTSDEPASVTLTPLTGGDAVNTTHAVGPGRLVRVPITGDDALGFLVTSPDPISVGWSVVGANGTAYAPALLVPDE